MKVFVAGATGVLGRRLVKSLRGQGHAVVGLTRHAAGEGFIAAVGGESRRADLFDADALARAAEGCEVLVHAATAIPTKAKTTPKDWEMNDRIRREGTRALTACAAEIGATHYVQQSVIWVARPEDGSYFDEDSPARPDAVTQSAFDGENIAREAGEKHGFSVAVLRGGMFYGPDSAHTIAFGEGLKGRRMPVVGKGDAYWSLIHTDDAAQAFAAACANPRSGIWHIVDDRPVSVMEFLDTFAERLSAPRPRRVPVWLARLLVGSGSVAFFLDSSRTSSDRFRRDFGWEPRYPTFREGIDQIASDWESGGKAADRT